MDQNESRIAAVENMFGITGTPLKQEGRILIGEGMLMKMCRKKPKQRHFFLFSDILVYGSIIIPKVKLRSQHIIELEEVEVQELDDNSLPYYGFCVKSPKKSFAIYATSAEEKEQWITHLRNCIDEYKKLNGSSRKPVTKSPVWIPDIMAPRCMQCHLTIFSLINRRHHCRCCGLVVCSSCSTKRWDLPYQCKHPVRVCDTCYEGLSKGSFKRRSGTGSSAYLAYKSKEPENVSETSSEDSDYDENQSVNLAGLINPNLSFILKDQH